MSDPFAISLEQQRAFIQQHTRLQRLAHVPEVRLHLADDIMMLWRLTQEAWKDEDVPPPFWAFAWVGGQAIARYLLDHPEEVTGKRVVDFATGSGLCAIAAMKAGAGSVLAADIAPISAIAVTTNARANDVQVTCTTGDMLDGAPPDTDVILAGDVCYEEQMAAGVLDWLRAAHAHGIRVLIGDPGRAYFPREELVRVADYQIATTRDLEGVAVKRTGVFTFPAR